MQDYLLDIGINDSLADTIRKCNRNFKTLLNNKARSDNSISADVEAALIELSEDLTRLIGTEEAARIEADSHLAPLNESGIIDPQYFPSYVDDIIEAYPLQSADPLSEHWLSEQPSGSPIEPEQGKIYVLMEATQSYSVNSQFRWGGTEYVPISSGVASDYENLYNKPQIEGVTLLGDKVFPELGIFIEPEEEYPQSDNYALDNFEIDALWNIS